MSYRVHRFLALLPLLIGSVLLWLGPPRVVDAETMPVDFARQIRPLLSNSCFACHGPDRSQSDSDVRLDQYDLAIESAIMPGDADASPLIERVTTDDPDLQMPPVSSNKGRLSPSQIELLRRWIEAGALYTQHWAYQPPQRPPVPEVSRADWPRNPIDYFIVAQNEARSVRQGKDADRRTLLRRLSFDLLGLPPNPTDVRRFQNDPAPDAYARLVDRLLDSQHFGERMAVFWLDLARYADTCGYHGDQHREIDVYRDYVIGAFNTNKPFDQFTVEQLAGDLMSSGGLESKIASGYNRLLQTTEEGGAQPQEYMAIYAADRVRNVATVWLGSTLGCAQCHDHKFDPFTTRDFYRYAAFFADVQEAAVGRQQPNLELPTAAQRQRLETLAQRIDELKRDHDSASSEDQQVKDTDGPSSSATSRSEELAELEREQGELQQAIRRTLVTMATTPRTTRVLSRGSWLDESGEIVQPDIPASFGSLAVSGRRATRLDLANWIVSPENPLTYRVFANHLWRLMFGEGLVRTPEDLGSQGQYPTHPELLDWLAVEFRERGGDVKYLIKLMVTSRTYQQTSQTDPEIQRRDPYNLWLARQNRFRMDAEFVRDNALAVSGLLARTVGGRSVKPYQPAGYWAQLNFPKREYQRDVGKDQYRRGVYTYWCRTFLHPSILAFDAPTREECTAQRPRSNTPLQALVLLNDPTYVEAARVLAQHILRSTAEDADDKIRWVFRQVLTRQPREAELNQLRQVYIDQLQQYGQDPQRAEQLIRVGQTRADNDLDKVELAAWTTVARVLLNLHETVTRY